MPHVGHADSIMNNERGSWSDISDWSSSNPDTRVVKVTIPTPPFLYIIIHSSIHAFIHSIHPRHRMCSQMHHNAPVCVMKR